MSHATYTIWCYVEGDNNIFYFEISSDELVGKLRKSIEDERKQFLKARGLDPSTITLLKVDILFNGEVFEKFNDKNQNYRPTPKDDDKILNPMLPICVEWPEAPRPGYIHVYARLPDSRTGISATLTKDALSGYDAAHVLYNATWRQDLGKRLQNVNGFDYLPAAEVEQLCLRHLGCNADVILFREEYNFTLNSLERREKKFTGGVVVTGHPGIGKSVFVYYALLRLLSEGQSVALQRENVFFMFSHRGVEMHSSVHSEDSPEPFSDLGGRIWALSDSTEATRQPCSAFRNGSLMGHAWIILASSPALERYGRLQKEYFLAIFVMDCITLEESRALSIIYGLNVEQFVENFKKWGPSARTCIALGIKITTVTELGYKARSAAKKFVKDPIAGATEVNSDTLFTTVPANTERSVPALRVATQHLYDIIRSEIASIDVTKQAIFYTKASRHPFFRGAFGYIFEKLFYVWLSSDPNNMPGLLCAPQSMSTTYDLEPLDLRPVGSENVIVYGGESGGRGYKSANNYKTPFAWIPVSRSDATFDAVICTNDHIITIEATVAAKHSAKEQGFQRLKDVLPKRFQKKRCWCHVLVTGHTKTATKLGKKTYEVADDKGITVYTTILNISLCKFPPEAFNHTKAPSGKSVGIEDLEIGDSDSDDDIDIK